MTDLILPLHPQSELRREMNPAFAAEDIARMLDKAEADERRRNFAKWDAWLAERGPGYWQVVLE